MLAADQTKSASPEVVRISASKSWALSGMNKIVWEAPAARLKLVVEEVAKHAGYCRE